MRDFLTLLLAITTVITLAGCSKNSKTTGAQELITFSDNILPSTKFWRLTK